MNAIQLHCKEENIIGTVYLKENVEFSEIADSWDKYLSELNEDDFPDIYEFAAKNSNICDVVFLDFYQPS